MTEILSTWRSPLDKVGIQAAQDLAVRQPQCSIGFGENFGAMTIYNYGYYLNLAMADPTEGLQFMFQAMLEANPVGGRAFIPQQSFGVDAPVGAIVPDQCDVDGSGGGGLLGSTSGSSFFHFVVTPQGPGKSIFLDCTNPSGGGHTSGGMYFRSLAFKWGPSTNAMDTCIYADVWNVRAINCTFTDCPLAFHATTSSLSCTLEQCTIDYTVSATQGPNGTKAVILESPECGVVGPGQFAQTSPSSGGATGCTCISIEGAEHPVISSLQILEWTTGIDFSHAQGTTWAQITNCTIECWQTALNIQLPATVSGTTASIKASGCILALAPDSPGVGSIVKIDAQLSTGNTNEQLNDITLRDCTVYNMAPGQLLPQHGLEILSGSDIGILGGTYSNNGRGGGAGIAITGACGDVQILGVNLQPSYPGAPNINSQTYALLVSAVLAGKVLVSGCDMTGYSHSPVSVTQTQSTLFIHDCPGYNDQNTPLNGGTPPTSSIAAATCTTPYFGPSVIIYSGNKTAVLNVFGQTITSNFGVVFLPSPYDLISFTTTPQFFSWIGK